MTLIHPFHEILLPLRIIPAVVSKTCFSRTSQKSGGHNLLYSMSDMLLALVDGSPFHYRSSERPYANFFGCYITEPNYKNLVIYAQLDTMICLKSRLKLCSNIVFVFSVSVNDSTQELRS